MILYHRTQILMDLGSYRYDEILKDNVWVSVPWNLITADISMEREKDPEVRRRFVLELPPPDPATFIPFKNVTERTVLDWIDRLTPEICELQRQNTCELQNRHQVS